MPEATKRGFSIRIFLADGIPEGIRVIEKSNWTGCGVVCPRSRFPTAKQRAEFGRAGIYVLIGPSDTSKLPSVYIGEGDPVRPRLEQHAAKKDFWTKAIIFTSKDGNLNKAHVQYLEARILKLAHEAKRCDLDNGNLPQLPSLSEADIAEVEGFMDEILLCFPVLGVDVFEKPAISGAEPELILKAKGILGKGVESEQGFVVRQGSQAVIEEVPSIHAYMSELRKSLVTKGILLPEGSVYRFSQDYVFDSPSTAAGVLLGRAANGRVEWKTPSGITLKELQQSQENF